MKWVFHENIFNVIDESTKDLELIFETEIHPVTLNDVRRVYNQSKSNEGPIVFWMLIESQDFILCTLLGDTLSTSHDIFVDEWNLFFFAEKFYTSFEEVKNSAHWLKEKTHQWNHLSELDYVFCLDWFRKNPDEVA